MRQFTLLCILILSTYISSQSKILEEHQQILKKAAITSENVNQLLIEAVHLLIRLSYIPKLRVASIFFLVRTLPL